MSDESPPPSPTALADYEDFLLTWSSTAVEPCSPFDDPSDAQKYLKAVLTLLHHSPASTALNGDPDRLVDLFRHLLTTCASEIDLHAPAPLEHSSHSFSLSLSLSLSHSISLSPVGSGEVSDDDHALPPRSRSLSLGGVGSISAGSRRSSSYRSATSIREIEVLPADSIQDLNLIAMWMAKAGRALDCVQAYAAVRKEVVEDCFRRLELESLSVEEVQALQGEDMEKKIKQWIKAAKICVRIVFYSELILSDSIFDGVSEASEDLAFSETVRGAADQLFGFAEAISTGERSTEKLFKIIDLYDAINELLVDISCVFRTELTQSVHAKANEIVSRLAKAIKAILSEFDDMVLRESSRTAVRGGTIHPITRYVMNYLTLIADYKDTLMKLIDTRPAVENEGELVLKIDLPDLGTRQALPAHLLWIIALLQHNIETKSTVYPDAALSHLFLINNVHYIANKIDRSAELKEMIGSEYLDKLKAKYKLSIVNYRKASWQKVLHCLRDEGIHVSGSFSSGISKSTVRERFRAFNTNFDEVRLAQSVWYVPDHELRKEIRDSIAEALMPAYRSFHGRFRQHIESGKNPENYIKYSVEELQKSLEDFFKGVAPSC